MTDAKPVSSEGSEPEDVEDAVALIREEVLLSLCRATGVPLDYVDGRPWVCTHFEAHPSIVWGDGRGDCGHALCEDTAGENLTGIMNHSGVTR